MSIAEGYYFATELDKNGIPTDKGFVIYKKVHNWINVPSVEVAEFENLETAESVAKCMNHLRRKIIEMIEE